MADKDHGPRIGADPELFVQNLEGLVIPICGKMGGTKEQPLIIDGLIDGEYGPEAGRRGADIGKIGHYAVQEDNVMLEFNVPAYRDSVYFQNAVEKIMNVMQKNLLTSRGLMARVDVMHTFKQDALEPFPQAFTVGCLPDMDAYAEGSKERPPFHATHFGNNRFCGGHLHVQYNHDNVPRHIFAQYMDLVAQLPFMRWDKQKMRRMFYGKPGLYREKPYGIEYRTPSNFWIGKQFREKYLTQLADNVLALAKLANNEPEHLRQNYANIDWADVQQAIKTEDHKLADDIVEHARYKLGLYICPPAPR